MVLLFSLSPYDLHIVIPVQWTLDLRSCSYFCVRRKQPSPEPQHRREFGKPEASANGKWSGPSHAQHDNFSAPSPTSPDFDDGQEDNKTDLDRRCVNFFFPILLFWIYFHVLNSSLYRLYSHVAIGGDRDLNGIRQKILLKQFQIMMQTTIVMMI